jgi:hypothetical protein
MDQEQYDLTGVNWFPESIEELPDWARPRDKVERELERIHKQARPYLETPRGLLLFW